MFARFADFLRNTDGTTSIEYALIAVLISLSIISGATRIGTNLISAFTQVGAAFALK